MDGGDVERGIVAGGVCGFRIGFGLCDGFGLEERRCGTTAQRADIDKERTGSSMGAAGEGCGEARGGARLHESGAYSVADKVVHEAGLAEADLCLCWVNVYVDLLRRHLEEEQDDGKGGRWEDVAVCLVECVENKFVADEALIHEDVDRVAIEFLQFRFGDEAAEAKIAWLGGSVIGVPLP